MPASIRNASTATGAVGKYDETTIDRCGKITNRFQQRVIVCEKRQPVLRENYNRINDQSHIRFSLLSQAIAPYGRKSPEAVVTSGSGTPASVESRGQNDLLCPVTWRKFGRPESNILRNWYEAPTIIPSASSGWNKWARACVASLATNGTVVIRRRRARRTSLAQ